jgi:predicted RNase H-like HicB family nuclease
MTQENKKPSIDHRIIKEEPEEMSWEEIEKTASTEIDAAIRFQKEVIVPKRETNWDRYYGRPLGNEIAGRSQYMSRDLLETVEWILPNLIKLFASADHKIELKVFSAWAEENGITPEQLGKALMDYIYKDLYSDESLGLFNVFYTWFKDALVSGSAYTKLFWEVDTTLAELDEIVDPFGLDELNALPEVTINQVKIQPTGQAEVKGTIERISKDQLVCDNIPHWEFIFEEHTRSMNDDTGKGFTTIVTMDYLRRVNEAFSTGDEEFFYNLDLVEALASDNSHIDYSNEEERKRYLDYEILNAFVGAKAKGPKRRVQLTEWHTRIDTTGDGFLEDVKIYQANGNMIRWELNEANFVPCAKLSPILDCYKFQGIAYADLIVELQDLKTNLMRKMLDNFDLQNSGRWFLKPNTPIDMARFLENVPGDIHRVDPKKISNEAPQGFNSSNLSLLEYVEGIKENRTGSTRYNQGTDAGSLNQTAHGIQTIMSASMKRIEMIGTLFAEGGIKDFFKKAALLVQQNLSEPFAAKINGINYTIPPEALDGKIEAFVDMGTEDQAGQIESQKLLQMSAVLFDLNSKYPGLVTPEKARNLAAKYVAVLGYNSDTYLASTDEFEQATQQAAEIQQAMQEMQVMLQQMEMQMKQEGVTIDKISAFGEIVMAQRELEAKLIIEKAKLKEKEGESFRTGRIDIFKEIAGQMQNLNGKQRSIEAPNQ